MSTTALPEARNVVNGAVAAGLEAAIDATEADNDIQVVVLTGAGRGFCAGCARSTRWCSQR